MNICALASPKNTDVEQRSPCQSFPQQKCPGNQRCQQLAARLMLFWISRKRRMRTASSRNKIGNFYLNTQSDRWLGNCQGHDKGMLQEMQGPWSGQVSLDCQLAVGCTGESQIPTSLQAPSLACGVKFQASKTPVFKSRAEGAWGLTWGCLLTSTHALCPVSMPACPRMHAHTHTHK